MIKNIKQMFFLWSFFLLGSTFVSCKGSSPLATMELVIERVAGGQVALTAEVADTDESRSRGYMERGEIPFGTGMIFIFDKDQQLSFWMKNTPHPLSIAYIDSRGVIREIYDMTPFSLSSCVSSVSVRYALEVPQGWFEEENISVGDKVIIPGKTE